MSEPYNHPQQPRPPGPPVPPWDQPQGQFNRSGYGGPPPGQPGPARKSRLPWIVAGGVLALILVVGGVVLATSGGDAESVQDVADQAVEAAQDLDVDAGIDLLCDAPSADERAELEQIIDGAKDKSGSDDPDADYEISDVTGDKEGSFVVSVTSDDPDLEAYASSFLIDVESQDGRSCIAGFTSVAG